MQIEKEFSGTFLKPIKKIEKKKIAKQNTKYSEINAIRDLIKIPFFLPLFLPVRMQIFFHAQKASILQNAQQNGHQSTHKPLFNVAESSFCRCVH